MLPACVHFRFRVTLPPVSFDVVSASRQQPISGVQVEEPEKMAAAKNGKSGLLEKVWSCLVFFQATLAQIEPRLRIICGLQQQQQQDPVSFPRLALLFAWHANVSSQRSTSPLCLTGSSQHEPPARGTIQCGAALVRSYCNNWFAKPISWLSPTRASWLGLSLALLASCCYILLPSVQTHCNALQTTACCSTQQPLMNKPG